MTPHIESSSNARIGATARLKDRRGRATSGLFLIEGSRETERAHAAGTAIAEVFLCRAYATDGTRTLAQSLAEYGIPLTTTSRPAFDKLSMRRHPDGIVAVAPLWDTSLTRLQNDLILAAESIEKPGNLGAMLRTADAAGAGLLIADPNVDPFNPNVVRASQGALFSIPFAVTDTATALDWALRRGSIVVASPTAPIEVWDVDLTGVTTVVIGSEHSGVSAQWSDAGQPVRIPMVGLADSLNASVAAAVLLYEAVRQSR